MELNLWSFFSLEDNNIQGRVHRGNRIIGAVQALQHLYSSSGRPLPRKCYPDSHADEARNEQFKQP